MKPQFDVENETYGWEEEPIYESDAWGRRRTRRRNPPPRTGRTADRRATTRERRSERSRAAEDIRPEVHEFAKREGEEEEGVVGP